MPVALGTVFAATGQPRGAAGASSPLCAASALTRLARGQSLQRRLLSASSPSLSAPDHRVLTVPALAECLALPEAVAAALVDCLEAAGPSPPPASAPRASDADAHDVLLLLFVNLFARPHVQSALRAADVWPAGRAAGAPPNPSPLSPSKHRRTPSPGGGDEAEALQTAFCRRNLAALLPLLRCTPAAGAAPHDLQLSAAEFDRLGLLFAADGCAPGSRLSECAPAFAGGVTRSVPLPAARDWLVAALGAGGARRAPRAGDAGVEGLKFGAAVLREADVSPAGTLRVSDCHEASVYCLAPCGLVCLSSCSDCVVFVAAACRGVRLEGCERVTLVAACRTAQLRSCRGCTLQLALARPLLLLPDSRGCRVGPHAAQWDGLPHALRAAGLAADMPQCWQSWLQLGAGAQPGAISSPGRPPLQLTQPEDATPFVVPFGAIAAVADDSAAPGGQARRAASPPFPLPPPYAAALEARARRVAELQRCVREAQLDDTKRREVQAAIQAAFREHLSASGALRSVLDLAKLQ